MGEILLEAIVANALAACLLVALAGLASRTRIVRPPVVHALWVLVFLKLLTPPLIHWPLPWSTRAPDVDPGHEAQLLVPEPNPLLTLDLMEGMEPQPLQTEFPWVGLLLTLGIAGGLGWASFTLWRAWQFSRLVRAAIPAPADLCQRVAVWAHSLGLRHVPHVGFLPWTLPPLVWSSWGRPRLVLPSGLWEQLEEAQRETVLVHELAHLRRGDPWVRILEFLVTTLYWWHPAVWLARKGLREAEELCCDAWVLWALPNCKVSYAQAILDSLAYLSNPKPTLPSIATGMSQIRNLKRRLTMILSHSTPRFLSPSGWLLILAVALGTLPWRPGAAEAQEPTKKSLDPTAVSGQKPKVSTDPFPSQPTPPRRNLSGIPVPNSDLPPPRDSPFPTPDRTEEIQKLRDEVELLEVQREARRAQVLVGETALKHAMEKESRVKALGRSAVSQEEVSGARNQVESARAQLDVKMAELREADVRLRQMQRRLQALTTSVGTIQPKPGLGIDRIQELEKKLDAILNTVEQLKRELRDTRSENPRTRDEFPTLVATSRMVSIPIKVDPKRMNDIRELVLYCSENEGETWSVAGKVPPDQKAITFKAPKDGLYCFRIDIVSKEGTTRLPAPGSSAEVRVRVQQER